MDLGLAYLKGLFQSGKRNIERLTEQTTDVDYDRMHHFISVSPWDHRAGFDRLARDTNDLFDEIECDFIGLLIDESAHVKKGDHSVGVSRQWCGTLGKVDNCQVAVYGGLSAQKYYGLVDTELYLPKEWTTDKRRCKRVGVPKERRVYRSKTELALDIVKRQVGLGTRFDFVGADGLYGNSTYFRQTLDDMELLKWRQVRLRQTGKGDLVCKGYLQTVYTHHKKSHSANNQ